MRTLTLVLAFMLLSTVCHAAYQQGWQRVRADLEGGGLMFSEVNDGIPSWRGGDIGAAVGYRFLRRISYTARFDHGFPLGKDSKFDRNFARTSVDVCVYPGPTEQNANSTISVGAGGLWYGRDNLKDWSGYEAHIQGNREFVPGWSVYGAYSHGFTSRSGRPAFDGVRAGVSRCIWP